MIRSARLVCALVLVAGAAPGRSAEVAGSWSGAIQLPDGTPTFRTTASAASPGWT